MSSINSYAYTVNDWEGLLEASLRTPELLASLEPERQFLVESLAEVQGLKAQQLELTALRQEATQKLQEAMRRGKDVAIRVRAVVRGKVGPRNERLVHYNVAPLRKRPRKAKETEPPAGETPEPGSEASASATAKPAA